jgi:hypothetical protein
LLEKVLGPLAPVAIAGTVFLFIVYGVASLGRRGTVVIKHTQEIGLPMDQERGYGSFRGCWRNGP